MATLTQRQFELLQKAFLMMAEENLSTMDLKLGVEPAESVTFYASIKNELVTIPRTVMTFEEYTDGCNETLGIFLYRSVEDSKDFPFSTEDELFPRYALIKTAPFELEDMEREDYEKFLEVAQEAAKFWDVELLVVAEYGDYFGDGPDNDNDDEGGAEQWENEHRTLGISPEQEAFENQMYGGDEW